jgi:hypothetical protein
LRILCRVAESFYIGDVQAKLQERAVDRRVRRSRSPTFLPVSSTMTGQSHTVTLKVVFALVWLIAAPQSPETNAQDTHRMSVDFVPAPA